MAITSPVTPKEIMEDRATALEADNAGSLTNRSPFPVRVGSSPPNAKGVVALAHSVTPDSPKGRVSPTPSLPTNEQEFDLQRVMAAVERM